MWTFSTRRQLILRPSSQSWNQVKSSNGLGFVTVQSFFKNNCLKICFRDRKSCFSTLECQFSFFFHWSLSSSNFRLCLLDTQVSEQLLSLRSQASCGGSQGSPILEMSRILLPVSQKMPNHGGESCTRTRQRQGLFHKHRQY